MKKLMVTIIAVLAIFTFIREYRAPAAQHVENTSINRAVPN
jgi:hypothetical protein